MSNFIGPTLPPNLLDRIPFDEKSDVTDSNGGDSPKDVHIGPFIPPHIRQSSSRRNTVESEVGPPLPLDHPTTFERKSSEIAKAFDEETMIGPILPIHLRKSNPEDHSENDSESETTASSKRQRTSLMQHIQSKLNDELPTVVEDETNKTSKIVLGPNLPPHLLETLHEDKSDDEEEEDTYGPVLPPGFSAKTDLPRMKDNIVIENDDEDMGPMPEGNVSNSRVQRQLEIRAQHLREAMAAGEYSSGEAPTQRESWMLELPADRAPELGLKPRQFRMREGVEAGDRSVWTDTPSDRERKKKDPQPQASDRGALETKAVQERDRAMQELAQQHSTKRGTRSLMDIHEEKLIAKRKKAQESGEVKERRPFSREEDLQVNRFDEAQKRSILKKAQLLNDRFSSGHSKYL